VSAATVAAALFGLAAPFALGGCSKGCKGDRPYVPYTIDEAGAVSPLAAEEDAGAAEDSGAFVFSAQVASPAPENTADWTLGPMRITAPEGKVFVLGLVADFDGDGAPDALTLVRRPEVLELGDLVFHRGKGDGVEAPSVVASAPSTSTSDPTCQPTSRLVQIGPRSVFAELGLACAGPGAETASRWLGVVTLQGAPRLHASMTLADPRGAPPITVEADGSDFDRDGVDDVALRFTLQAGGPPFEPAPPVSAVLRFFDRSAGMSRDPLEPEASLRTLASQAAARAARAKDAAQVPQLVAQMRRLYGALCAEGGAKRLRRVLGTGALACGASRALEDANLAEVRAFAMTGDVLRAAAALEGAQRAPATHTASKRSDAEGWITNAAPVAIATEMRAVAAVPQIHRGTSPGWGALAFEPSGKLLVRTAAGIVRVDPELGDEAAADDVPVWKANVVAPDGKFRWIEAYYPCTGFAVEATFAPTGDDDPRQVPLPLDPPLAASCTSAKGNPVAAVPVAWGARGLEMVVSGVPVLLGSDYSRATLVASFSEQPFVHGAPRSPNGRVFVYPTSIGLVVRDGKTRLYRAKELDGGYAELRDCAVSDDAKRVACVRSGRVYIGTWPSP
jgi:hypothetical protein